MFSTLSTTNKSLCFETSPTCTVRAPVFGRHQFFGTSEHYGKAHGSLLSGWMNYNYTACCWFPTSSNISILPSQFWQIRFESYCLHCSKCRILQYSYGITLASLMIESFSLNAKSWHSKILLTVSTLLTTVWQLQCCQIILTKVILWIFKSSLLGHCWGRHKPGCGPAWSAGLGRGRRWLVSLLLLRRCRAATATATATVGGAFPTSRFHSFLVDELQQVILRDRRSDALTHSCVQRKDGKRLFSTTDSPF